MNGLLERILNTIRQPGLTVRKLRERIAPLRPTLRSRNRARFLEYGRLARLQGFDRLYVALSFDCDTPEDIPAAEHINAWLSKRGLKATYAVPGAQLLEGRETYRRIHAMGADFINHGARPHAEWRDGRYWSITFYNELSHQEVTEDIQKGHEIYQDVLGCSPLGFRAPHFGYFQTQAQRHLMYSVLAHLGYRYSSSTMPEFGLRNGPVMAESDHIYEIPLSGSYETPETILDSWNYVDSPTHPVLTPRYRDLFVQTVDKLLEWNVPGLLNYYVDPAHVYSADVFYQTMEYLLNRRVETLYFNEVLKIARLSCSRL